MLSQRERKKRGITHIIAKTNTYDGKKAMNALYTIAKIAHKTTLEGVDQAQMGKL